MSDELLAGLPVLAISGAALLEPSGWGALEQVLPGYMQPRRWFSGKARGLASARVQAAIPLLYAGQLSHLVLVRVLYADDGGETYLLPLAFAGAARAAELAATVPHALVAHAGE
ncbi:MAG TPA: hypothetical protein PKK15_24825, partial [Kouleothrix sp.]|nr:hypothetical protein [Kouleothrix sp.]